MLTIDIRDYLRDFVLLLIIDVKVKATRQARIIIELLFLKDIERKQSTIKNKLKKSIISISKFKSKSKSKNNTTFSIFEKFKNSISKLFFTDTTQIEATIFTKIAIIVFSRVFVTIFENFFS